MLAYISIAFFAVFGALKLYELTGKNRNVFILPGLLLVTLIIQFYSNFDKVNQHGIYTFEDYTKAVVGSVTEDAIIFSYQWDYFISSSYYYQNVEDYRKDVAVIKNIRLLGEMGLTFDLQIFPEWYETGQQLVDKCPDTLFVLNHCGRPDPVALFLEGKEDRTIHLLISV